MINIVYLRHLTDRITTPPCCTDT